jgi:DNA-binding FadR family transcriptional regulator
MADVVAAHIRKLVVRGELRDGDYLQPESRLIESFATSRPTLREAFRILENEGLISVSRGSRKGARVHRPSVDGVVRYAGYVLQSEGGTLADVYEARLAIEPFAARLAAERSTPETVAILKADLEVLDRALKAKALPEYYALIAGFHQRVVDLSGNKTLSLMARLLHGVVEKHQFRFVDKDGGVREFRKGVRSREKMVDLIAAHDGAGAEAHWRSYLEASNRVWLQGYDGAAVVDILD